MTRTKHVPLSTSSRGRVIYTCSCGWVGKPKDTYASARRLFDAHLNRVGSRREQLAAEGKRHA